MSVDPGDAQKVSAKEQKLKKQQKKSRKQNKKQKRKERRKQKKEWLDTTVEVTIINKAGKFTGTTTHKAVHAFLTDDMVTTIGLEQPLKSRYSKVWVPYQDGTVVRYHRNT